MAHSHVLVYHGPLLSHLLGVASHRLSLWCNWDDPPSVRYPFLSAFPGHHFSIGPRHSGMLVTVSLALPTSGTVVLFNTGKNSENPKTWGNPSPKHRIYGLFTDTWMLACLWNKSRWNTLILWERDSIEQHTVTKRNIHIFVHLLYHETIAHLLQKNNHKFL